jgi:hypothetical protein
MSEVHSLVDECEGKVYIIYFPSIRFLFNCNIMEHTKYPVIPWIFSIIVVFLNSILKYNSYES